MATKPPAKTAKQPVARTATTAAGAAPAGNDTTAGVLHLAAGRADEATERLAEQAQRPAVTLPAGQAVYRVLSPLNHDLRDYPAGSDITLTVDQAAPLLGHTVEPKDAPEADA